MPAHDRQIVANVFFEIRASLCTISGYILRISEKAPTSPEKTVTWLERWKPRVERWWTAVGALREHWIVDPEAQAHWENIIARLCQELADVETALAETQGWPKEMPQDIQGDISLLLRGLAYLEELRQKLLRQEYKQWVLKP